MFADRFQKVYGVPSTNRNNLNYMLPELNVTNIQLTKEEIFLALSSLNITKGVGPDQVPASLLKNCAEALSLPLYYIFNKSLNTGAFPDQFKSSFLIPIYKNGCRSDVANYRGIAIISAIPKLFEKFVCSKLSEMVIPVMNDQQHGFLKSRSTNTNLVIYTSKIMNQLESGKQIDSIYTDFSKASDRVNHEILFHKLKALGVSGNLLHWLISYLSNRTQQIKFQGKISKLVNVTSGVPQGSHLGPLLFNIFIKDLSIVLEGIDHIFYADDLKIFHTIHSECDVNFLQDKIAILKAWCDDNVLQLNVNKCHVISFSRRNQKIIFDYKIDQEKLKRVKEVNDLGVILDEKLTFKPHFDFTLARAYKILGFIKRRAKEFNNLWVTKTLYCSYVRSILEFASVVWMPYTDEYINRFESVQKQFLLFALRNYFNPKDFLNLPSYEVRLKIIELEPLHFRRNLLGACFIFDILEGNIKVQQLNESVKFNTNRQTRHSKLLIEPFHNTSYGRNEPITRNIRLFNSFSSIYDSTNNNTKHTFKRKAKKLFNSSR